MGLLVAGILFLAGFDLEEKIHESEREEKNEAGQALFEKRVYTKSNDLIRLAIRCDYDLEERKEGTLVKYKDKVIVVIPRHREINYNTARGIMRSLANRRSYFRQKNY